MQSHYMIQHQPVSEGISQIQNRPTAESVIVFRPLVCREQYSGPRISDQAIS